MQFDIQMIQVNGKEKARRFVAFFLFSFILSLIGVTAYIGYIEYKNGTGNFAFCGEQLTKCELARLLKENQIPINQINDWVCLVKHESHLRTNVVSRSNRSGKLMYGLFQINGESWCEVDAPGGGCNVTCETLLQNLDKSVDCAQIIHKRYGFHAWNAWEEYCKNKKLEDYTHCLKRKN